MERQWCTDLFGNDLTGIRPIKGRLLTPVMAAETNSPPSKKARRDSGNENGPEITSHLDKSNLERRNSSACCSTSAEIVSVSGGSSSSSSSSHTHTNSGGQSSQTDHSGPSLSSLPGRLSDWTRSHTEGLNIKIAFQPDTSPLSLITKPVPCTGEIGVRVLKYDVERIKNRERERKKKVSVIADFVKRSGFLDVIQNLNCSSFEELNIDSLLKLDSYQDWCFVPKGIPDNLQAWFNRFDIFGKQFIYVLSRMVEYLIQRVPNKDGQFQHLFDSMVKMFGMQSEISFEPCHPIQCLGMGNVEVEGAPDMVYAHHRINYKDKKVEKPRIVAVCEVKNKKPILPESPPSCRTRKQTVDINQDRDEVSSSSKQEYDQSILQLSDDLIGQHCGQLLYKYSQSIGYSSIYGLVVQQTCVTLTELGMTKTQHQKIIDGKIKHGDRDMPTFMYTKAYNFLKKGDLEKLMEAFIMLGLEQEQFSFHN